MDGIEKAKLETLYAESKQMFASAVKEFRGKIGYSQADLANAINVSTGYIGDVERGKINVTLETIILLALGLRTTPSSLLNAIDPVQQQFLTELSK